MRHPLFIALLFGFAGLVQAQNTGIPVDTPNVRTAPQQDTSAAHDWNAAENKEVQGELMMSLEDHGLSGLNVNVTDKAIEVSGKVLSKSQKQLARDVVEAFLLDRKLHDHISIGAR